MQILLAAEVGDTDTKNQFLTRYTGIPDTNGEYPSEAELTTWIEADEMDRLISALKKFTPTRKEHTAYLSDYNRSGIQYLFLRCMVWYQ